MNNNMWKFYLENGDIATRREEIKGKVVSVELYKRNEEHKCYDLVMMTTNEATIKSLIEKWDA